MARGLDGNSGYVSVPELSSAFTTEATLSLLVKLDSANPGSGKTGFVSLGRDAFGEVSHYPWWANGNAYLSVFRNTGSRIDSIPLSSVDRTLWHRVTIVSQPGAGGWRFYQNDVLVKSTTGHAALTFRAGDWWLGRTGDTGGHYLAGAFAEVAVWNVALDATDIAILNQGFAAPLVGHRRANLMLYQDLIRPLNRPGIGPAATAPGSTSVVPHPRAMGRPGHVMLGQAGAVPFPWTLPLLSDAREAEASGADVGETFLSGADNGAIIPAGEVTT